MDTIRLRGIRAANGNFEAKVWLNDTMLKMDKSLKIKTHSLRGFGWGNDGKGGLQLALAICLELYPTETVKHVYPAFYTWFLEDILEDGFDMTLDLTGFNIGVVGAWE